MNGCSILKRLVAAGVACAMVLLAACASGGPEAGPGEGPPGGPGPRSVSRGLPPALPDSGGWGVHVLMLKRSDEGALWVGTYGAGIFALRPDERQWQHIVSHANDSTSISWDFVNSLAFSGDSTVWYGTVGNGFGRSVDGGRTWRNWTVNRLGPEWLYVAPDGIRAVGDTVYIATADGLRITWDDGATWRCIGASEAVAGGAAARGDGCTERIAALPSDYLLAMDVGPDGSIWVGHLRGLSVSVDAGLNWRTLDDSTGVPPARIRAVAVTPDTVVWAASETAVYVDSLRTGRFEHVEIDIPGLSGKMGAPRAIVPVPAPPADLRGMVAPDLPPAIATSFGLAASDGGTYRLYYLAAGEEYRPAADMWSAVWWGPPLWPIGGSAAGLDRVLAGENRKGPANGQMALPGTTPAEPLHAWFARPIDAAEGNPYIDATYRYGSTMGGNFQQHQGVEFNNPAGVPVHAIGDGVVIFAGKAEAGANTVAIRHDRKWRDQYVFSTYYHNSSLAVTAGQRVRAGDVIARVGNTGRATNEHLHLEVHVAASEDSSAIVNADERFPPHTVNPQLWLDPLPGTGIVAGRVIDAAGKPVPGARIYGLVLAYPEETPYSYAETYGDRAHGDPAYNENFVVGDVPAGSYLIGVTIGNARAWRTIRVEAGKLTWVQFSP